MAILYSREVILTYFICFRSSILTTDDGSLIPPPGLGLLMDGDCTTLLTDLRILLSRIDGG